MGFHRILLCLGMLVPAFTARSELLNVQILGHGANATGGSDAPAPAYRGAGVAGGDQDHWNPVRADAFNKALEIQRPPQFLAADGKTPLPVRLKFRGFNGADYFPAADGAPVSNPILNSYLVGGAGAGVTIEGLQPGKPYDVWFFASNSRAGAGATFTVNGGGPKTARGSAGEVFAAGTDFVEFTQVAADAGGRLTIALAPADAAVFPGVILNALQLRGEFPKRSDSAAKDPHRWALKAWLKAEDLATRGLHPGDPVREWKDAGWGLRFVPDSQPPMLDEAPAYFEVSVPGSANKVPVVRFNGEAGLRQLDAAEARDDEITAFVIFRSHDSPGWKKILARRHGALCTYDGDVSSPRVPRGYHTAYRESGLRLGASDRLPVAVTGHQGEYNRDTRFRGDIAEILVFARRFEATDDQGVNEELQSIERYLNAKYFEPDGTAAASAPPWLPAPRITAVPAPAPGQAPPAQDARIGLHGPNIFSMAAGGKPGVIEYAAGDVTLPFSYAVEVSDRPRPKPLDFPGQPNPDCCHAFVRMDGELWMFRIDFIADKGRIGRFKGPDIDTMTRMEDGAYPPEVGLGWLLGGLWYDQAERKLYAPVHIEQEGSYRFHPAWGWFSRKIGLATSVDKGKTWDYAGDIITPETYYHTRDAYKFSGSDTSNGVADFGFYVDTRGGYFYVYPLESWYPKGQWGARWAPRVARCAISDKMAPGKWRYFYQGAWNQSALGGKSSIVGASSFWGILYSTTLNRYISIAPFNKDPWWPPHSFNVDGVIIGTCTDLSKQDWVWGHFPEGMHGFMKLFNAEGNDVETCGDRLRFYSFFADNSFQNLDLTLLDTPMRVNQGTPRFGFQPNPESSDPILSRRTKIVGSASPEMKYSGAWQEKHEPQEYYEGRVNESSTAGSSVEFSFVGPDIYWRALRSPGSGRADVFIDGSYCRTVDCYSPRATVSENFVFVKTGLEPDRPHTIKVVVRGEHHPKSTGSAVGHMACEFAAESDRASFGFSSIMGKNNWRYLERQGDRESRLRFLASDEVFTRDWQGVGDVRIGATYQIAEPGREAVRQWVAPHPGTVRIEGRVRSEPASAASATLLKGFQKLWRADPGATDADAAHDVTIEVVQGDTLDCVVATTANQPAKVSWDPVITYTRSEPAVHRPNPPGEENLALGRYARSKVLSFAAQPFHAVDEDPRSAFAIHADDRIAFGDDWLHVDLGRSCTMDRYVVVSTPPVAEWRPARFLLQKSDDGFTWTDVETVTDNHQDRVDRSVPPFTARHVRLYLPDGKPFFVNELELYHGGPSR